MHLKSRPTLLQVLLFQIFSNSCLFSGLNWSEG
jgi:hypothetical protein